MNLKYKTILSDSIPYGLLLSVARVICIVVIAYYMGQAVTSGVHTLGSIIYSLFPVFALAGILLVLETQQGNFTSLFSLPALADIKASKKHLPFFVVILIAGVLLVFYSGINSPVDLIMILLVILAVVFSVILMFSGQSIEAFCVFILAWPFIIFENGHKRAFFYLTNYFSDTLKFDVGEAASFIYICLLLMCWLIGLLINPRRLVPASRSLGVWLFVGAGLLSTIFSLQPATSMVQFIFAILLPVLLFVFFVNEVRSLIDLKKLSLALGFTVTIITIIWFYYTFYRHAETGLTMSDFAFMRGGGGRFLGSRTTDYGGFLYDAISPLIIPCILALSATATNIRTKRLWMVIVILMITATLLTFGRVGWLATLLCLLPWIWKHRRGRLLGILSLTGCFILFFYFQETFAIIFSRFSFLLSSANIQEAINVRIWIAAVSIFLDNPWTGVGLNMFQQFSSDYDLVVYVLGEPVYIIEAHGTFFQIISEMGILGFIAWSFMLWIPFRSILGRTKKNVSWPVEESPWIIALQSYSLLLIYYFFLGSLSWWPVESPRIILFFLWFAVISNKDVLLKELRQSKDYVTNQSGRI